MIYYMCLRISIHSEKLMLNMDSLTIIEINPREVAKMKKNKEGIMIKAKNNR